MKRPKGSKACLDRFWSKIDIREDGECWEWKAGAGKDWPYGVFYPTSFSRTVAHRFAYELTHSVEIPAGMFACHTCDNPRCANPHHIFIGTCKDNSQDMTRKGRHWGASKTHCDNGHERTPENTYWFKGVRRCLTCKRKQGREVEQRRRDRMKMEKAA